MRRVKIGIVGVGNIGSAHASTIYSGLASTLELCALCDNDEKRAGELKEEYKDIEIYSSYEEMIDSGKIEAVIISTPHYLHPVIATYALNKGLSVLSEKPLGVYTLSLKEPFEAQKRTNALYATMLNQRTDKLFIIAKEIIDSGKIGALIRNSWTITNWYRTDEYYQSGDWRATWQGEGGGVLMNQAPHNLDLWQYLCGMPKRVYAVCNEGKWHDIEVEDEATIYAEYENGMSGTFIASTGEKYGTNRFEIVGAKGKIVLEKGRLLCQYEQNGEEAKIEYSDEEYNGHLNILNNFGEAILYGKELIAPASEAINQLIICNSAYLSSWKGEWVQLPFDQGEFLELLSKRVKNSKAKRKQNGTNLFKNSYKKKWSTNW